MRKIITAALLSLSLAGCASTGGLTPPDANSPDVTRVIADVKTAAQAACSFVPTASSIIALFTAANGAFTTVEAIANAICSAVTKSGVTRSGVARTPVVVVHGRAVTIRGRFVR